MRNLLEPSRLVVFLAGTATVLACGPFLARTVLDRPRAALATPVGAFGYELAVIDRHRSGNPPGIRASTRPAPLPYKPFDPSDQIIDEITELEGWWKTQGKSEQEVEELAKNYQDWRAENTAENATTPGATVEENAAEPPVNIPLPDDVSYYLESVAALRSGDRAKARKIWQELLELPKEQRQMRSSWAAWMLAKTSRTLRDAEPWFERVNSLAAEGFADSLNLSAAALGWRAALENDPIEKLLLYYEGATAGCSRLLVDVRNSSLAIALTTDTTLMERTVRNPLASKIVTAAIVCQDDNPDFIEIRQRWIPVLEKLGSQDVANASRIAWLCYRDGQFEDAVKWAGVARKDDPSALWLLGKLELRKGKADRAARILGKAISYFRPLRDDDIDPNLRQASWRDTELMAEVVRGTFIADYGMTLIAREEFINAMDWLDRGSYSKDATYLAEHILTTDELLSWVEHRFPSWAPKPGDNEPWYGGVRTSGDRWRYLVGRRLAREYRYKEARPFIPEPIQKAFDRYVELHRAGRGGEYSGDQQAAILWEKALIHRKLGMELFGYNGYPDGGYYQGYFPATDTGVYRRVFSGETIEDQNYSGPSWFLKDAHDNLKQGPAVPAISKDELRRLMDASPNPSKRFHYRYNAAAIAWEAANHLPNGHPALAYIYNTAGGWIKYRDPNAADRYYKALVWRNLDTDAGMEADEKRWFIDIPEPESGMPELPDALKAGRLEDLRD